MKQLHDRRAFKPVKIEDLSEEEKKNVMESLSFLVEKDKDKIKGRFCANGSTQHAHIDRDDTASPTASTNGVLVTAVIDAKEKKML